MTGQDAYGRLLTILRAGGRMPQSTIDSILIASGHSTRDLLVALHVGPTSGTPIVCEACGEPLGVVSSRRRGATVVQYLACPVCGWKPTPNRRTVPAASVPTRRRKKHRTT